MVGLGQGGLVVAALRWPLVIELTLHTRNLQRKEARSAGEAWAGLKAVWPIRPKLWKTQSGHSEVAEACPELARDFPEPPVRGFGIVGKIAAAEEVLKALRLDAARSIEDSSIRGMLDEPSRELWDHDGTCVCGKRTYLFSRCPSCISSRKLSIQQSKSASAEPEAAADLDQERQEVSLEVGALVAATCAAGGAQELSFLSSPKKGLVATPYGKVRGSFWESGPIRTLSLGSVAAEVADAHWASCRDSRPSGGPVLGLEGCPAPLEY